MLTMYPGAMGGGETYAREVTRQLVRQPGIDTTVFVPSNAEGWSDSAREVAIPSIHSGTGPRARILGMASAYAYAGKARQAMKEADVVYFPFTVPVPWPARRQAFVQMIFDVQHLDLPGLFTPAERVFRHFAYERSARRADAIITISEFTKARIVHHLGIAPSRVHVSHLGADLRHFTPHWGPRERFLLYPARAWPHKNHARLFEAFAVLRVRHPDLRLVLTGGNLAKLGDLPDGVEWAGQVSQKVLAELYQRAAALVFPSLYEGFGLPPLEAMASACPVASSNAGSLPEICGEAAELFDPVDVKSIAQAVERALRNAPELSRRGVRRAAEFSWERCGREHADVFREVASGRKTV
jgi:glycosyltransferase involved in cell wall biosynthesis